MVVQISTLRVTSDFDASGYRTGMAQKIAADQAGAASSTALGAALAKQDVAADNTGGSLGRLSRNYIDGYGSSARFYGAVANLQRQMELGNVSAERAELIYTGLIAKFGMVASAAEAAASGNVNLAGVIERVNAVTDTTVVGLTGMGAAFDIARLKAEQAGQAFQSSLNQSFGIGAGGKSARDSASVFEAAARETEQFAAQAAKLRGQIDPLAAAMDRYIAELNEYVSLAERGVITTNELASAEALAGQKFATTAANIKAGGVAGTFLGAGDAAKLSAFQIQNLSFQMQDVGQAILTGQPLFRTFIQQGSQIAQIFGPGVGVTGAMKALGQGLLQYVTNPINLAFLALAGLAAGVGALFTLIRSGGGTDAAEVLKRHEETIKEIKKSWDEAGRSAEQYGVRVRNAVVFQGRTDRESLTDLLNSQQANMAGRLNFQAGGALGGLLGMAGSQWGPLQGAVDRFSQAVKEGRGNVANLNDEIRAIALNHPADSALQMDARLIVNMGLDATKTTAALKELNDQMRYLAAGKPVPKNRDMFDVGFGDTETAKDSLRRGLLALHPPTATDQAAKAIDSVIKNLRFQEDQLSRTSREQEIYNSLNQAGVTINSEAGRTIAELVGHIYDQKEATAAAAKSQQELIQRMDDVRSSGKDVLGTIVGDLRQGKTAAEAFADGLGKISDKLMDMAENSAIDALFGKTGTAGGNTGLLSKLLSGLVGGVSGGVSGGLYHAGGIVGSTLVPNRYIHRAYVDAAPRIHGGLKPDEFVGILQRGERVESVAQVARGGGGGQPIVIHAETIVNVAGGVDDKTLAVIRATQAQTEKRILQVVPHVVAKANRNRIGR